MEEAVSRLKKRLSHVQVTVHLPDEPIFVPMDPMLIEQVLMNLIENASYHSGATKPIVCKVEDKDNYVLFRIIDFGTGIDPERLTKIFDGTVYSKNHTSDGHKGMGIGLSICKAIILAHGGQINARNHTDGAEFYFSLPKEESNDEF